MSTIFVSYRRDDASGHAGRLYDRLSDRFGKESLFRDVDQIRYGEDFVEAIEGAVDSCRALVAIIGPNWLTVEDKHGKRRLDNPYDFVRLEIATALTRGIPVLPVLVGGAQMPDAEELPDSMSGLARRQALEISETRFDYDIGQLIESLRPDVAPSEGTAATDAAPPRTVEQRSPPARPTSPGLVAELQVLTLPASVRHKLATLSETLQLRFLDLYSGHKRSTPVAYLLLLLLPPLGLHNTYLRFTKRQIAFVAVSAVIFLGVVSVIRGSSDELLFWALFIWPAIDLFWVPQLVRKSNRLLAQRIVFDAMDEEKA